MTLLFPKKARHQVPRLYIDMSPGAAAPDLRPPCFCGSLSP